MFIYTISDILGGIFFLIIAIVFALTAIDNYSGKRKNKDE